MSLRRRLLSVFAAYLAMILAGTALVTWVIVDQRAAIERDRQLDVAGADAVALGTGFLEQQTSQRGYLLTGDGSFLETFRESRGNAGRLLRSPELRDADAAIARMTQQVEEHWRGWLRDGAEPLIESRQGGESPPPAAQEGADRLFSALSDGVDGLLPAIAAKDREVEDEIADLRLILTLTLIVLLVIALGITLWASRVVRRWVTSPIDEIADAARAVRAGARHTTIPATGPVEIARLGADVEDMRRRLNAALLDAVRSREAVAQSASVLLTLRSQLEPSFGDLPRDWTVAARIEPAEGLVAGDCCDVQLLEGGRLSALVIDVAGHGAGPAVLALRCQELLRVALRDGLDPGDALAWAHEQLEDLEDEAFLSAFVAVADLETGELRYANAGHPPPLLCLETEVVELAPTGPVVGPVDGEWRTASATITGGDTLAVYTDGVIEARGDEREEYGLDRLVDLVCGASCDEAQAVTKRVIEEVAGFASSRLHDDATVLLLCRGPRVDRAPVRLSAPDAPETSASAV